MGCLCDSAFQITGHSPDRPATMVKLDVLEQKIKNRLLQNVKTSLHDFELRNLNKIKKIYIEVIFLVLLFVNVRII